MQKSPPSASRLPTRDQRPWWTRHCLAYGVHFRLRSREDATLTALLNVLPHATTILDTSPANDTPPDASHPDAPTFTLTSRPGDPRFPASLERTERQIFVHVATHAPDRVFLHAGVVGWHGRAILFPGSTCAGKTTLVAELVRRGALYYSDDYALLDPTGLVHPYARLPRVRQPGGLEQQTVSLHQLGGRAGTAPIPVAQIVFTHFARGAEWSPQPLTPGLAVLELLRHAPAAQRRPAHVLATLKAVMLNAQACRSPRGEAGPTAELLLRTLDAAPSPQ